jgi:DNA polymerase-3 subunit delta'
MTLDEPDRLPGAPHPRETAALFGQEAAEADFLAALDAGRLHHGWMIAGPRGVGKATLAWRIARALLAEAPGPGLAMDPADPVFRQVAALASPRLLLVRRPWDDKTDRLKTAIGVDEVRLLNGFFRLSAADGGWRVVIVDAADELTPAAANALLKVLEEPPDRAVLLLVSHQPTRLLPTIRSRCRALRCRPLEPDELARALDAVGVAPDASVALAGGSVGTALRLARGGGLELWGDITGLLAATPLDRRRAVALAESCAGRDAGARYELALELIRLALARLALHGAGGAVAPVGEAEARAMERLAATPVQARLWAETATRLGYRADQARALHLDPAQVILDALLGIDAAAAQALRRAA